MGQAEWTFPLVPVNYRTIFTIKIRLENENRFTVQGYNSP